MKATILKTQRVYLFLILFFVTGAIFGANILGGTTLYLTAGVWDDSGTARFAAYFYTGTSTGIFVDMSLVSGSTDAYEVTSPPATYTNVIFCRMNGSTSTNSWANVWNQTDDLTFDGINNIYTISSWGTTKSTGDWSAQISYEALLSDYYDVSPVCSNEGGLTFIPDLTSTKDAINGPEYVCNSGTSYKNQIHYPSFYYIKISKAGTLIFDITMDGDVDYIIWGPYEGSDVRLTDLTADKIDFRRDTNNKCYSCSFTPDWSETATLENVLVGDYYILMISNFDQVSSPISLTTNSASTGESDCSIVTNPCVINTINPSFELPVGASGMVNQTTVPGWKTTASDGVIEFWRSGDQGVPAYEGSAFIELNANMVAGVYQDYDTPDPVVFNFSFAHRGRSGTDVCKVSAGPVGGPYVQIMTASDSNTAWGVHTGSYTVPTNQTTTRFLFESVSSVGGASLGNFLDAITFTATIAPPSVPENSIEYCVGETPAVFTDLVTGTNLTWYTSETGGTGSSSMPVISTATTGTTLTYVTQTINGCESPRAIVTVEVKNCVSNPINLLVNGTENTVCNGTVTAPVSCTYNGPSIVINEIMVAPETGDGSLFYRNNQNLGGEWVELYNPNPCQSIDISNYVLGNYTEEGGATFVFPQGTVVPAQGFVIVRGMNAQPISSERLVQNGGNVVEIELDATSITYCITDADGDARFWLSNGAGWLAIYDKTLQAQDAIAWGDMSIFASVFAGNPCNPFPSVGTVPASFNEISSSKKAAMAIDVLEGMTFYREQDGGAWVTNARSYPGTYGACNSTCAEPYSGGGGTPGGSTCTGTATVTASGGTAPYTYLWDDPLAQTDATATGLCAGTYTVTVTDATNQTKTIEYTVENEVKTSTISDEIYQGQSYTAHGFDLPIQTETGVFTHELTTQTSLGCDSIVTLTLTVQEREAISLSVDGTLNTVCNGTVEPPVVDCDYTGPSIVINEIMVAPQTGDGALGRGEWVELYNPNPCQSIDISGYLLGNYTSEGGATFTFPQGTIVPAKGFVIVRGQIVESVPSSSLIQNGGNVVELVISPGSNVCIKACAGCTIGGDRFWLPNSGGWLAIYDTRNNPQDAISWGSDITSGNPCNPSASTSTSIPSYNDISSSQKAAITIDVLEGMTFYREQDGGTWMTNARSYPGTYGACNATCAEPYTGDGGETPGSSTCTGTATVTASGGTAPYTYLWDDSSAQTDATATGLCAGTYTVTVTDATNQTKMIEYTVENEVKTSTISDEIYQGQSYTANGFDLPIQTETGVFTHELTTQTSLGCDSIVTLTLTVQEREAISLSVDGTLNTVCNGVVSIPVSLFELKYYEEQVKDVQRSPSYPSVGQLFTVSGYQSPNVPATNPVRKLTSMDWQDGAYISFVDAGSVADITDVIIKTRIENAVGSSVMDKDNIRVVKAILYNSDGTQRSVISDCGILWGFASNGFLHVDYTTSMEYGTFYFTELISGSSLTYPPDYTVVNSLESLTNYLRSGIEDTPGSSTCTGTATVTVSGGIAPYTYSWDDPLAQTTATATGLCAGTYTVTVTDDTNQTKTIEYTVENYIPEVTHQQIDVCSTDIPFNLLSLTDKAFPLGGNYAGNNIQDNILTSFDTNTVTATYTYAENGCENTTSFQISIINLDETTITPDTHICQGESVLLSVSNFPSQSTILWEGYGIRNPSYVNQTVSPNQTERYAVHVERGQCSTVLETLVTVNENPIITGFVEDSQLAGAGQVVYTKGTSPYEFFLQDQNKYSYTGYFDGIEIGNHTVQVVDANMCKATFSFYLDISIIPDIFFTPNGDGVNDVWTIKNIHLVSHSVYIYDRFGKLLYTYEDDFDGWDGTYQGNPLPNTDYWFLIKIKPINKQLTGHFTLKR